MRRFLLTWYGITDLRASLGFENTDGPIAGALLAESYSDIVILGYTRADNDSNACIEVQRKFSLEWTSIRDAAQEKDWKTTDPFVSRFANTTTAHEHFVGWLKAKVKNAGSGAKIWFKSEKLRELNDTEGIYACAMRALDWVAQESGEKLVTLYLSPGTPVMAFVWAFAALGHPELKRRLIASPVIGKSPETISLPADWLERHGAKRQAARDAAGGFDVTFHLFGEQRMPSLLAIRQFESKHHIFVNSKEYPATCMQAFLGSSAFDELPVAPWDDRSVHEQIIRYAEKLPDNTRIGVNLTGGTKLMFAGALSAARALGAVSFYFDSQNHRVIFFDSLRRETIKPIESIETFLLLNGDRLKLSKMGLMEEWSSDRRLLTEALWKRRAKLARCYKELCEKSNDHEKLRKRNADLTPFKVEYNGLCFEFREGKVASIVGDGLDLHFENWIDFAKYLSGGWFEEYVYGQCKPYEDIGVIKDLRINVRLQLDQENSRGLSHWDTEYNELDIAFTDGSSLYIVECKAGNVTQEQVMKLQNLVRFYGGVEGRGIVACCFPPKAESVQKRIKDARLTLCCDKLFSEQIKALMNGIAERAKSNGGV